MILQSIVIISIILLFGLLNSLKISISSPAGIYCIIWSSLVMFSVLLLNDKYYFSYIGVLWIILSCYFFVIGYNTKSRISKNNIYNRDLPKIPWILFTFFILLGFISVYISTTSYGVSLGSVTNINQLQESTRSVTEQRYSGGEVSKNIIMQLLSSFIYILPLCAGYSILYADNIKKKILIIFSFIPTLISMLVTSAKLAVVTYLILFFISYYIAFVYKNRSLIHINFKMLLYTIATIFIFWKLLFFSFVLRIGNNVANNTEIITNKLALYAFGHIQSFDVWFDNQNFSLFNLDFGSNTFLAIASFLKIKNKQQGVYGFINGSSSNIFTPFRALISDFGPVVSLLIIFVIGIIIKKLLVSIEFSDSRNLIFEQVFLISLLFYLWFTFISPWVYMTYIFTFLIFYIYVVVAFKLHIKFKFR